MIIFSGDFDYPYHDSIINLSNQLPGFFNINITADDIIKKQQELHALDYYMKLLSIEKTKEIIEREKSLSSASFAIFKDNFPLRFCDFNISLQHEIQQIEQLEEQLEYIPQMPILFIACCRSNDECNQVVSYLENVKNILSKYQVHFILIVDRGQRYTTFTSKLTNMKVVNCILYSHLNLNDEIGDLSFPENWDVIITSKPTFPLQTIELQQQWIKGEKQISQLYEEFGFFPPITLHDSLNLKILNATKFTHIVLQKTCRSCGASSALISLAHQFESKFGVKSVCIFKNSPSAHSFQQYLTSIPPGKPFLFIFDDDLPVPAFEITKDLSFKQIRIVSVQSIHNPDQFQSLTTWKITPFVAKEKLLTLINYLCTLFPERKNPLEKLYQDTTITPSIYLRNLNIFIFAAEFGSTSPFNFVSSQLDELLHKDVLSIEDIETSKDFICALCFQNYFAPRQHVEFELFKSYIRNYVINLPQFEQCRIFQFPRKYIKVHPYVSLIFFKYIEQSPFNITFMLQTFASVLTIFGNNLSVIDLFNEMIDPVLRLLTLYISYSPVNEDNVIGEVETFVQNLKSYPLIRFPTLIKSSKFLRCLSKNNNNASNHKLQMKSKELAECALELSSLNNENSNLAKNNLASILIRLKMFSDAHSLLVETLTGELTDRQRKRTINQAIKSFGRYPYIPECADILSYWNSIKDFSDEVSHYKSDHHSETYGFSYKEFIEYYTVKHVDQSMEN